MARMQDIYKAQESAESRTVSRFAEMSETVKEYAGNIAVEEVFIAKTEEQPWRTELLKMKEMLSSLDMSVREQAALVQELHANKGTPADKEMLELQTRLELALRQSENRVDKWISDVNKCMSE